MDKEKEIDRMVEIARKNAQKINSETGDCATVEDDMTALYEANYRKADEVRKETAKQIKRYIKNNLPLDGSSLELIDEIFEEFGVEADE